jgi:FMN phosphatase YigB (HAD superfamily)
VVLTRPTAITFDLWNTLVFEPDQQQVSAERRNLRAKYGVAELSSMGESVDHDVLFRVLNEVSDEITRGHDHGRDSHYGEWVRSALLKVDSGLPDRIGEVGIATFGSAIDVAFIELPPRLLDGSLEMIDELLELGLRIGLVTNTGFTSGGTQREWFRSIGLRRRLEHMAFSNELAIAKPNRIIYDVTIRALGVSASRVLHVGDNLHTDIRGAAALGISTVWAKGKVPSQQSVTVEAAKPDFTVETVLELPAIVEQWMESLDD